MKHYGDREVAYPVRSADSGTDWEGLLAFALIGLPVILSGLLTAGWIVWSLVDLIA